MKRLIAWLALILVVGLVPVLAEEAEQPDSSNRPYEMTPFRVEIGGYGHHVTDGFGPWGGFSSAVWVRANSFFVPAFLFDSQTRPQGTQQNYAFFSYLNWTKSFYTTQGFSASPEGPVERVYFPKRRYDIRAHYKLPPGRQFILAGGFTRFEMGAPNHGQIYNVGGIYYHDRWVMEGTVYVNHLQPGDHYSGAGSFAVQYGREGKAWTGVTGGGGREAYRTRGDLPLDVRFNSYSLQLFHRRWVSRNVGIVGSVEYQDRRTVYRRIGGGLGLFFEF